MKENICDRINNKMLQLLIYLFYFQLLYIFLFNNLYYIKIAKN
jgi:hypothetical protein